MVDQEASLTVGLGKLAANRNRVGLCGLLRLCVFSFSSTLAHNSASTRLLLTCASRSRPSAIGADRLKEHHAALDTLGQIANEVVGIADIPSFHNMHWFGD